MTELKYKKGDKVWVPVEIGEVDDDKFPYGIENEELGLDCWVSKKLEKVAIPLPVIPQFVADWIEDCKKKCFSLHGAYKITTDENPEVTAWRFKNGNSELFALAWIFGYEVEKEKKYWVRALNGTSMIHKVNDELKVAPGYVADYQKDKKEFFTFTEKEIKSFDERYWAFAVEVEE